MGLPDVSISRLNGQLGRVKPTIDNVFGFVVSGVATDEMGLGVPKLITGVADLETLEITLAENPLAFNTITRFYAQAAEGTECYLIMYVNTTDLEDVCDKATGVVKTLLDFAEGRIRGIFVGKKFANDYTATITTGLDADVLAAVTKLQALCVERGSGNDPLFAVIPGYGFDYDTVAAMPDLNQATNDQVAYLIGADDSAGSAAIGTLAGWLAKNEVHQNPARVASGSVLDNAWLLDGTTAKAAKDKWAILHDKRYIFFRKIFQKSGFFFNDDPTATSVDGDYSSISWNRIINKAHVLAYGVLVEKLNDDVEIEPSTGKISPSLAGNWESDVENEIGRLMVNTRQISAVKCTVDPDSDIVNDTLSATIEIVRNGQAKNITVNIGFVPSV